ncbi:MAG: class I SAM-dependent methyltransferase [Phycisphaerales bacterium]
MFTETEAFYDRFYAAKGKDYDAESAKVLDFIEARRKGAGPLRSLLDVACGTGQHLSRFERRIESVAGVDLDPKMIEVARARAPRAEFRVGDMRDFDFDGRTFDAVTCLFSSIGYLLSNEALEDAIATMARHLAPGGVLVVEPWIAPDQYKEGGVYSIFIDDADFKAARLTTTERDGRTSILHFHYLIGTAEDGVKYLTERHVSTLFTRAEHEAAFRAAGLEVEYDEEGLIGRGLYLATKAD